MGRAIFKPIPVDEGFCIVLQTLLNEPYGHERNCEKRGRRPNYVELFDLFHLTKAIESDSSLSWFMPLPEKMDHDTLMELIHRMTDAWETYCLHYQTLQPWVMITFGLPNAFLFLSLFFMDISYDKAPPLWWNTCIWAVLVPIILILERMKKMLKAPTKEYGKNQERIVKDMQLAFKCSGYSAEFVVVQ